MSQKEIDELLEINSEENTTLLPSGQNVFKHIGIRIGIILFIIGSFFCYAEYGDLGTNDTLGLALAGAIVFLAWLLFLVIEALVLHFNKKPVLRNTNLIIVGGLVLFIFLWIAGLR